MRSPVRIWVAAPRNEATHSGCFFSFLGAATRFEFGFLASRENQFAFATRSLSSSLVKRRVRESSLREYLGFPYLPHIRVVFCFGIAPRDSNSVFSPREKASSHSPPEDRQARLAGKGCANLRFSEYLGFSISTTRSGCFFCFLELLPDFALLTPRGSSVKFDRIIAKS